LSVYFQFFHSGFVLYFQYFNQLRENIIRSQPPDKQAAMAQWFENLMDGIERNLLTKNRDRLVPFDTNLSVAGVSFCVVFTEFILLL